MVESFSPGGTLPDVETVETSVRHGLCGDPSSEPVGDHVKGGSLYNGGAIEATYEAGGIIDIEIVVTAHHRGHFEFFICDASELNGGQVTQECLMKNRLIRAEDPNARSPIDPQYPHRYYIEPKCAGNHDRDVSFDSKLSENGYGHGQRMLMKYSLPSDLACEHCILQFHYMTGNTCLAPGYRTRTWPSTYSSCAGDGGGSGWWADHLPDCNSPGASYGEEFWNCADVKISSTGGVQETAAPARTTTTKAETTQALGTTTLVTDAPTSNKMKRIVAYVPNWKACPTNDQLQHYTHAMIAFAVTYKWGSDPHCKSDRSCTIQNVAGCGGKSIKQMVTDIQGAGVKVLLSFGGAGMGGSWEPRGTNDCWDVCIGQEDHVVSQLVELSKSLGVDGLDIDYEYHLDTSKDVDFLRKVTLGVRKALPSPFLVTHAPMDSDMCGDGIEGTATARCINENKYFNLMKEISSSVDFIMPQYYNGVARPSTSPEYFRAHYKALVDGAFGGDSGKVDIGFCLSDCGGTGSNINSQDAAKVISDMMQHNPGHGGIMLWETGHDTCGRWTKPIYDMYSAKGMIATRIEQLPVSPECESVPSDSDCFVSDATSATHTCGLWLAAASASLGVDVDDLGVMTPHPTMNEPWVWDSDVPTCKRQNGQWMPSIALWAQVNYRVCRKDAPQPTTTTRTITTKTETSTMHEEPTTRSTRAATTTTNVAETVLNGQNCYVGTAAGDCRMYLQAASAHLGVSLASLGTHEVPVDLNPNVWQPSTVPRCTTDSNGEWKMDVMLWGGVTYRMCKKDVINPTNAKTTTTTAISSTSSVDTTTEYMTTAEIDGVWYCRRPGRKSGGYTVQKCQRQCNTASFIEARCCRPGAGKYCAQWEQMDLASCTSSQPKCP